MPSAPEALLPAAPAPEALPPSVAAPGLARFPMHLRHAFFGRRGGVSVGAHASLNVGSDVGDDPARVAENRRRAALALGAAPDGFAFLRQVHSARAVVVDAPFDPMTRPEADGAATRTPGLALAIVTADCAPVLLCDPVAGVIGAAHAGWRGAVDGVVEATLDAMASLGAEPARITAAIGPHIRPASFEIGPEVEERVLAASPWARDHFAPGAGDRSFFDLGAYLQGRLARCGVRTTDLVNEDVRALPEVYFSHRAAQAAGAAHAGRNLSAILLHAG